MNAPILATLKPADTFAQRLHEVDVVAGKMLRSRGLDPWLDRKREDDDFYNLVRALALRVDAQFAQVANAEAPPVPGEQREAWQAYETKEILQCAACTDAAYLLGLAMWIRVSTGRV